MARVIERYFPRTDYTGGGSGSLDQIDGSALKDADVAIVSTHDSFSLYHCNFTGGQSEDYPHIIVPDVNPGAINWELLSGIFKGLTIYNDPTNGNGVGNRNYNDSRHPLLPVENSQLADMAESTIKGRATAGSGDPEDLTAAQVRSIINVEDGADVTDAANVAAAGAVMNIGDESVGGVKTFSSFPITPSSLPTTNYQVANKKYIDDHAGVAKGWVAMSVDPNATPPDDIITILDSFNVAAVQDNGVGNYSIIWETNFETTHYSVTFGSSETTAATTEDGSASFLTVTVWDFISHVQSDSNYLCVTAHGKQ